jgi:hypothetical protein
MEIRFYPVMKTEYIKSLQDELDRLKTITGVKKELKIAGLQDRMDKKRVKS